MKIYKEIDGVLHEIELSPIECCNLYASLQLLEDMGRIKQTINDVFEAKEMEGDTYFVPEETLRTYEKIIKSKEAIKEIAEMARKVIESSDTYWELIQESCDFAIAEYCNKKMKDGVYA